MTTAIDTTKVTSRRQQRRNRASRAACAALIRPVSIGVAITGGIVAAVASALQFSSDPVLAVAVLILPAVIIPVGLLYALPSLILNAKFKDDPAFVQRAEKLSWHSWFRRNHRTLVRTEGAALAALAIGTPMYVFIAGFGWRPGAGTVVRDLPPNIDQVLTWALWVPFVGSSITGFIAASTIAIWFIKQHTADSQGFGRAPKIAWWTTITGLLWVIASMITTGVIVNALAMT